jgi:hypothetical protein
MRTRSAQTRRKPAAAWLIYYQKNNSIFLAFVFYGYILAKYSGGLLKI